MKTSQQPPMVQAAQEQTTLSAALAYAALGLSTIPLDGKRPALTTWTKYQQAAASQETIKAWSSARLLKNIGIVCGRVPGNLVVLDLDGAAGYPAFAATFPVLTETYTVASGGGVGKHIYFYADSLPSNVKAMGTPIGNLELCGDGRQVVAPPSTHPTTGQPYRVERALDIMRVLDLTELAAWIEAFRPRQAVREWQPPTRMNFLTGDAPLNPRVIDAIGRTLAGQGFKQHGDWLHGSCIHPERHKNSDRNPSFGFNTQTGYGHCYVCGTMLAKEICEALNIDPDRVGGLVERPQPPIIQTQPTVKRKPAPDKPHDPPAAPTDYRLPDWLQQYMDWSGTTGNQTPMLFHQAAGLWLLVTAVGRRLYGEAPWGVKIYPNLYLMLVAGTTFYHKSTAYKLGEQVARAAIPHMLMPTPGSPEHFQEALAGRLPSNFDKLVQEQRERLTKAQPFAAQRGLLKDEVAGLFGAINRKDYMVGMKDLLMELYDCPDYFDKDTQTGLNIVENAALSILGVTTPASLSCTVSMGDWDNGLLIRFGLLTPEPNYTERPAAKTYRSVPQALVDDLRSLHERLPAPQNTEMGLAAPSALRLNVECWEQCQQYGDWLRRKCDPRQDTELDDRLKGVYGRMHVQAFKLAALFAALDWLKTSDEVPTVTVVHWHAAQALAEGWRGSAHRLLKQLDRSGEATIERRQQERMLSGIRAKGQQGIELRDLYRQMHVTAKVGRQVAQELVKAGLVGEACINGAEAYTAIEYFSAQ